MPSAKRSFVDPRDVHIPEVSLARIERQRLDGADAEQASATRNAPRSASARYDAFDFPPVGRQHGDEPQPRSMPRDRDNNGRHRRTEEEHHRHETTAVVEIQHRPNNCPIRKLRIFQISFMS